MHRLFGAFFVLSLAAPCVWADNPSTFELPIYDATPEPGKPLGWSAEVSRLHEDMRNLEPGVPQPVKVTQADPGPGPQAFLIVPEQPGTYLAIITVRVDGWRMVDRRTPRIVVLPDAPIEPLTLRCPIRNGRGPYSTGETTIFRRGPHTLVVRLTTDRLANVFAGQQPLKYTVEIQADLDQPATVQASLIDWQANERKLETWQAAPKADAPVRRELTASVDAPGFYRLKVAVDGWGEATLDGGLLAAPPENNDRLGVNVTWSDRYTHDPEQIEGAAELLALQGVRWLRTEYEWRTAEWTRGTYNWEWFDFYRQVCSKHGMSMLPAIYRVPQWASVQPDKPEYMHCIMKKEYFEDYYRYIEALARRYRDWIKVYSIWNEIDSSWFMGGTADDYFTLLKESYPRIKAIDPQLQTTSSGFAYTGPGTGGDFGRRVFELGGAKYFDIFDVHYVNRTKVDSFKKDLKATTEAEKPVWVTEQSGHRIADRTLTAAAQQAIGRTTGLIEALAANPEKVFLWGDIDQHPNLCLWGNVTAEDRTVRPAYFAFANLIRMLADRRCAKVYSETPELVAYRFEKPNAAGPHVLVLWSGSDTSATIDGVSETAELIDLMGKSSRLATTHNRLVLPVTQAPLYLLSETAPAQVRPAATFTTRELTAAPEASVEFALVVQNPSSENSSADVTLELPDGWTASPDRHQIALAAGAEQTCVFRVQLPASAPVGQSIPVAGQVTGLTDNPIKASAVVRVTTPEGVMLIEAESSPRSQGQCPGSPMFIAASGNASGDAVVAMFWGDGWMEYDVPFAQAGRYRLAVRAYGRLSGHSDEVPGELRLVATLNDQPIGHFDYRTESETKYLDFTVDSPGLKTIKLHFPKDTGDLFVDFLTLQRVGEGKPPQ